VTALPRWRWAGAAAGGLIAVAAVIAACEAPRPVGPQAPSDRPAVIETERGPNSPGASYLQVLAHEYHPEVFAHPLPGAAVALVFDATGRVIAHAAGVRTATDDDCLAVVERLVPEFRASKWSSSGCAGASSTRQYACVGGPCPGVSAARGGNEMFPVVVYWKALQRGQGSDDVLTDSMVDERPVFLSGPPLEYPQLLRQAGIQGRVLVRAVIDTTGRAEPASVQVVESPHPGFDQAARDFVLRTRFRPARVHRRAVRWLITFPVNFRTGR